MIRFPFLVWHPRCGPCPSNELRAIIDGAAISGNQINGNMVDTECDRSSNSVMSEMQVYLERFHRVFIFTDTHF